MAHDLQITLNGNAVEFHRLLGDQPLLWNIRDKGLKGTKFGCGDGGCGGCSVLLDDNAITSCTMPLKNVAGSSVTTIEAWPQAGQSVLQAPAECTDVARSFAPAREDRL